MSEIPKDQMAAAKRIHTECIAVQAGLKPGLPWSPIALALANNANEVARLLRCINAAMKCLKPLSANIDERLAWFRLLDAVGRREPRDRL